MQDRSSRGFSQNPGNYLAGPGGPPREPHPPQQPVLSDELVIERGKQVQDDKAGQQQRKIAMRHEARKSVKARRQRFAGSLKHASVEPGQNRRGKAAPGHQQDQQVKCVMGDRRDPAQRGIARRRIRRLPRADADDEADDHERQDRHSDRHVDPQNIDLVRISIGHRLKLEKADAQHGDDQHGHQPVQDHQQRMETRNKRCFHSRLRRHALLLENRSAGRVGKRPQDGIGCAVHIIP
jgi:hypothetical protein